MTRPDFDIRRPCQPGHSYVPRHDTANATAVDDHPARIGTRGRTTRAVGCSSVMVLSMMTGLSVRSSGRASEAFGWALKTARTAPGETASAASFPGAVGGLTETLMRRPG